MPEAATIVIEEQLASNGVLLSWIKREEFDRFLLEKVRTLELAVENEGIAFLDRSFPGGVACSRFYDTNLLEDYIKASKTNKYAGVFLMELLPRYKADEFRKEDAQTRQAIHNLIRQAYVELGYSVIKVPVMSVDKRVEFILRHLA